jgi:hypothetical protein
MPNQTNKTDFVISEFAEPAEITTTIHKTYTFEDIEIMIIKHNDQYIWICNPLMEILSTETNKNTYKGSSSNFEDLTTPYIFNINNKIEFQINEIVKSFPNLTQPTTVSVTANLAEAKPIKFRSLWVWQITEIIEGCHLRMPEGKYPIKLNIVSKNSLDSYTVI